MLLLDVANPHPMGHMCRSIALTVDQHKIITLHKTVRDIWCFFFFFGDSIVWFSGVNFVASIVLQCQKVAMPASLSQGTKSE